MERTKVESSVIQEIGYDKDHEVLEVLFLSGELYQYEKVPHNIFVSFMTAPSYGTFYNEYIKHQYEYERINRAEE